MLFKRVLLVSVLFYSNNIIANGLPDSVMHKLSRLSNDSLKINYLNNFAEKTYPFDVNLAIEALNYSEKICKNQTKLKRSYADILMLKLIILPFSGNYKDAEKYGRLGFKFSKENKLEKEIASFNFNFGTLKFEMQENDSAIYYFNQAILYFTKQNDSLSLSQVYFNLANVYEELGLLEKSLEILNKALKIDIKLKRRKGIAYCYNSIGLLYQGLQDHKKAIPFFKESIKIRTEDGDTLSASRPLSNLAMSLYEMENYEQSYFYLTRAIEIKEKYNDKNSLLNSYLNFGSLLFKLNRLEESRFYFDKTISLANEMNSELHKYMALSNSSPLLNQQGKHYENIKNLKQCEQYFRKTKNIAELKNTQEYLYKTYQNIGDYKNAFYHLNQFDSLKFFVFKEQSAKALEEFNIQYETEKKELEIERLKFIETENQLLIQRQKNKNNVLLFTIVAVLILSILLFINHTSKQKRNLLQTTLDIEHAERTRIARDMHDELGSGLSKLGIISQLIKKKELSQHELTSYLNSIKETSFGLIENMSSLVWSLNPEHQSIDSFIAKLREYFSNYIEGLNIEFEFKISGTMNKEYQFSRELVKHLFPACKEAVNNAIKHAFASKIAILITFEETLVNFKISDNGVGLKETNKLGNGINNLKKRIELCKGTMEIDSKNGTSILFKNIPLEKNN
jgi:signal transduction histidine kinase